MQDFTYIGIGSSAGGLQALQKLLTQLRTTANCAIIIAQHTDPAKKSVLREILQKHTQLPVQVIRKNTHYRANHIYIIPPGNNLHFKNNKLILQQTTNTNHLPIPSADTLFMALAAYKKEHTVGILLSGSGHDGTQGLQSIKDAGGITIAQSPQEATYANMPQNAIDAGVVDYILEIDAIANMLQNSSEMRTTPLLKTITELLNEKEHFDVKKYKSETILRRIHKRMLLLGIESLQTYVKYLRDHTQELTILHQNILIGVTKFFRDKEAFDALEEELLLYLQDKPQNYELRVWSIACSTGEEAYSLAILIAQVSKKIGKTFDVHIFATDIDEQALQKAREARYTQAVVDSIDAEILARYFTPIDNGYKVIEDIRKQIIFTKHNVLREPPFINQDLVSCRNLLIYIKPTAQKEIFRLLHYVLKDDGILFLGSSESTLSSVEYFTVLNSQYRIYMKEKLKNPPKIASHYFTKHLEDKRMFESEQAPKKDAINIKALLKENIFEFFAPNFIVTDSSYNIIYKQGSLDFLEIPDGYFSSNIIDNLQSSLQYDVNQVLKKALHLQILQATHFIELDNKPQTFIRVIVMPYKQHNSASLLFVYFQYLQAKELQFALSSIDEDHESLLLQSITTQLQVAQKENKELSDSIIATKENMQLLNEELQSSNEELQSSNEELETANEELQSSNEELHLSLDNEQQLQNQLSLILNATQDGIIGLDINGDHTFVNDAAVRILGYTREELIGHNAHRIWHHTKPDGTPYPFEECTLHSHLVNKKALREEDLFYKKDGSPIDVAILQNPIVENTKVLGAVLSFHDITEQKSLQKRVQHEQALANLYLTTVGTLVMTLDLQGNITMINREGAEILGLTQEKLIGKNWFDNFLEKEFLSEVKKVFHAVVSGESELTTHHTNTIINAHKQRYLIAWTNHYTKDTDGNITGLITSGIDITKEEALSQRVAKQEQLYRLTFEEADIGIAHTTLDGKWIDTNEYMSHLLGYTKAEFQAMTVTQITATEDLDEEKRMMQELLNEKQESYHIEKRYIHKNGTLVWVSLSVVLLKSEQGLPLYLLKIIRDISQLKLLMYQLQSEKERLKKIIDFLPIPLFAYDETGAIVLINNVFLATLGYTKEELPTIDLFMEHLFHFEDATARKEIKKYYKNPTAYKNMQQSIITKSGQKRTGILNAVRLQTEEQETKKLYLIAIMDITELQKKDELMVAQSRQAAMGDMLAMVAHQWRQPLSVISMLANNFKVQKELGEEISDEAIKHFITTLNQQTSYLSHTIDDFRDFFKPDKEKELVDLHTLFQKAQTLIAKSLQDNDITYTIDYDENIQAIKTYPNQLTQVILNILNNAKDAIKDNGIENGLIRAQLQQKKKHIEIAICDNGGGIDASILEKLGEPYVTTKSKNGTGLGIYMSNIIVTKQLGGTLTWKNKDKGCCFAISLPL